VIENYLIIFLFIIEVIKMETEEQIKERMKVYEELVDGGFIRKEFEEKVKEWIAILEVILSLNE